MKLFVIVLAILILQVWGAKNPLHKDGWLDRWFAYLRHYFASTSYQYFLIAVCVPTLVLASVFWLLMLTSTWVVLPLEVFVLLYAFGRGEFGAIVQEYNNACLVNDWSIAVERAQRLGVNTETIVQDDWSLLHHRVLQEAGYRGFERMFAVLFWFFLCGPAGALLYRLIFLFGVKEEAENPTYEKALRWMEWPVARLLALSFTITGNFVGCYKSCRHHLAHLSISTRELLSASILGALSVDEDVPQTCEVTQKELKLLDRLYVRTLWFWLFCIAIFIILV